MEKGCGTSALQGCGGLKTHKIFPVFSIPPRDPAFLSSQQLPVTRGICRWGIGHRNIGALVLLVGCGVREEARGC